MRALVLTLNLLVAQALLLGQLAPVWARSAKAAPGVSSALERGIAALAAQDLETAGRLLTEAYRAAPRTEVLYHLGLLAVAQGRVLDAHDLFRRYLADPARDPDEEATRTAEHFIEKPPPPGGTAAVQSDPGAIVLVDGHVVGTLPLLLPLYLTAGEHTVALEFANKRLAAPFPVSVGRLTEVRLSKSSGAVVVSVIPAILFYAELTNVTAAEARLLADITEQAARGEQYTLLGAQLAVGQALELKQCLNQESCQRQLAARNQSDFVLQERIRRTGDAAQPSWQFDLRLLHVDIDRPAAAQKTQCAGCSPEEAAARLRELTGKLLGEGLYRPRGTLRVMTEPAAVRLRIGEGAEVQAPYRATLWSGRYDLRASLPGYKVDERTVEVPDGNTIELSIALSKDGAGAAGPPREGFTRSRGVRPPTPKWRLALGGTMIGIGIGMVGLGAAGVVKNGECETPPTIEGDTCMLIYKTGTVGGIALGSGVLLGAAGGLLMGVKEPRR